ncbi:ankyrin repeat-containing domain protein [Xylogone sp. PMI_703]|nr:ankyrin repeat-containing domain protein [Xylogone sp. PMI_703]
MIAVQGNNQASVNLLLSMGAKMQCLWEETQQSLFDIAIDAGYSDLAQFLVLCGCFRSQKVAHIRRPGVSDPESDKESLVMLSYTGEIREIESIIHESDSSYSVKDLGEALHAASARGYLYVVKLLVRNGAQVNERDITGRTALHYATKYLHEDIADYLMESGANISLEDNVGSTPIDLAVVSGMKAASFIQKYMDDFALNISRRPSLLAVTPNQSTDLTVMGTRAAISGSWSGYFEHIAWQPGERYPFSLDIPRESLQSLRRCTFTNDGGDHVGKFQFHGFVDPAGVVWFVKLYSAHGWLYRGQVDPKERTLKGAWGINRKLWFGTFKLTRKD